MSSQPPADSSLQQTRLKRVLLKLSGEALMGSRPFGHDDAAIGKLADEISETVAAGVQVAIVVGGGNIFRGVSDAAGNMDRVAADHMGMLATVMNALALEDGLNRRQVAARAMSAIPMPSICEPYTRSGALRHMADGQVVIFAAGTGNPYFTTDTAAALRAAEMGCDALLKGTQVDGVYSADPNVDPSAQRFDRVSYTDVLAKQLRVMDATAISLCRENNMPIIVYSNQEQGMLANILSGGGKYTLVDAVGETASGH